MIADRKISLYPSHEGRPAQGQEFVVFFVIPDRI
jgi:hypothetical protein